MTAKRVRNLFFAIAALGAFMIFFRKFFGGHLPLPAGWPIAALVLVLGGLVGGLVAHCFEGGDDRPEGFETETIGHRLGRIAVPSGRLRVFDLRDPSFCFEVAVPGGHCEFFADLRGSGQPSTRQIQRLFARPACDDDDDKPWARRAVVVDCGVLVIADADFAIAETSWERASIWCGENWERDTPSRWHLYPESEPLAFMVLDVGEGSYLTELRCSPSGAPEMFIDCREYYTEEDDDPDFDTAEIEIG